VSKYGALKPLELPKSSRFRGVSWRKDNEQWQAFIAVKRKQRHLGYFDDEREAARAYDRAAIRLHREKATLNFKSP